MASCAAKILDPILYVCGTWYAGGGSLGIGAESAEEEGLLKYDGGASLESVILEGIAIAKERLPYELKYRLAMRILFISNSAGLGRDRL